MRPLMALAGLILMVSSLFLFSLSKQTTLPALQTSKNELVEKFLASNSKVPLALGALGAAAFFAGAALPSSEEPGARRGLDPEFISFMEEMRALRSKLESGLISEEEFNRLRAEVYQRHRALFQRYLGRRER